MESTLIIAVLSGLSGMFGWGLADFFAKKTIDTVGDTATLMWAHIYGVVIVCSIVLARATAGNQVVNIPTQTKELGVLAFFGVLQALVYFFVYRAFGKGKLAILNPVFSSYSGIVVLLSVIIFKEVLPQWQLVTLFFIFMGIVVMNIDHDSFAIKKLKLTKVSGMFDILAAVALAAIWTVLWSNFVSGKDWLVYAAIMYIFMTITIFFICMVQRINLNVLTPKTWKYFFLIGISEVVAYIGVSYGYSLTSHTSIVAVLSAAFSLPTFLLAYWLLKERVNIFQVIGAVIVVAGVVLVSLG